MCPSTGLRNCAHEILHCSLSTKKYTLLILILNYKILFLSHLAGIYWRMAQKETTDMHHRHVE